MTADGAIVLVTTSYPIDGDGREAAGAFVRDLAEELATRVPVRVVAPGRDERVEAPRAGVIVHRYAAPDRPLSTMRPWMPSEATAIARVMRSGLAATRAAVATGATLYRSRPDVFGDAGALPFPDDSVDAVLLLEVLEHLPDPRAALGEIARVLKPGGTLLLTMPFPYPVHDAPHDYQRYTPHGLEQGLEAVGLNIRNLRPRFSAAVSAAVLLNLALSGIALIAARNRHPSILIAPVLLEILPLVNLAGWVLGRILPDWNAFTIGFVVIANMNLISPDPQPMKLVAMRSFGSA